MLSSMHLYFSDIFEVSPKVLDKYGAFNISLVTNRPLFRKDSGRAGMTGKMTRIDGMVYALYGLTPEEIAIVEEKK